jgi:hypothetical protein
MCASTSVHVCVLILCTVQSGALEFAPRVPYIDLETFQSVCVSVCVCIYTQTHTHTSELSN